MNSQCLLESEIYRTSARHGKFGQNPFELWKKGGGNFPFTEIKMQLVFDLWEEVMLEM